MEKAMTVNDFALREMGGELLVLEDIINEIEVLRDDVRASCEIMVEKGEYYPEEIINIIVPKYHNISNRFFVAAKNMKNVIEFVVEERHESDTSASGQEPLEPETQTQGAATANPKGRKK